MKEMFEYQWTNSQMFCWMEGSWLKRSVQRWRAAACRCMMDVSSWTGRCFGTCINNQPQLYRRREVLHSGHRHRGKSRLSGLIFVFRLVSIPQDQDLMSQMSTGHIRYDVCGLFAAVNDSSLHDNCSVVVLLTNCCSLFHHI